MILSSQNYPKAEKTQVEIIKPQDGGQVAFLSNSAFELLFWGDTGGGKTYALLFDVLGFQYREVIGRAAYEVPEYRGYIFRRKTNRLSEVIDKARLIFKHLGGQFVYGRKGDPGASWTFPSGAKVFFCHMKDEADKFNYHGIPMHYAGFDELTEFLISQYTYIFSRTRSTIPGLFPRVRGTTNAVGIGVKWVRMRFIDQQEVNKIYYFTTNEDPEINPQGKFSDQSNPAAISRSNVISELSENDALMIADPLYKHKIAALGPKYQMALLEKNWYAFEGQRFPLLSRNIHIIKPFDIPDDWFKAGGMDYGTTTVFEMCYRDPNYCKYFTHEWTYEGGTSSERALKFINWLDAQSLLMKEFTIHYDSNMDSLFTEFADVVKVSAANKFRSALKEAGSPIKMRAVIKKPTNNKPFRVFCTREFEDNIQWVKSESGLFIKEPSVKFFDRCTKIFETMLELACDEQNPEDVDEHAKNDHWFDAGKYVLINMSGEYVDKDKIKKNLNEHFKKQLKKAY